MLLEIKTKNTVVKDVFLNGRQIDILDFGEISKTNRDGMDFKMSELRFIPKVCTDDVLIKYGISEDKYKSITKYLEKEIKSVLF